MILTVRNRRDTTETIVHRLAPVRFPGLRENSSGIVWQLSEESAAPSPGPTTLELGRARPTITISGTDGVGQRRAGARRHLRGARRHSVRRLDNSPLRSSQLGSPLEVSRSADRSMPPPLHHEHIVRINDPRTSPVPGSRANSSGPACITPWWPRSCSTRRSIPPPSKKSRLAGCAA